MAQGILDKFLDGDEEKIAAMKKSMNSGKPKGKAPGGGLDAAGEGASQGAAAGPAGMVAGAALGLLKRQAQAKAFNRELQGDSFRKSGQIAQETGKAEQSALARLMSKLRLENQIIG